MCRPFPALVLGACLLSSACGSTSSSGSPTSPTTQPDIKVEMTSTLQPGQRVSVTGTNLAIQFTGVSHDSRCPADAMCITVGEAVAVFEATLAARGGVRLELSTLQTRRSGDVGDFRVELRALDPYPFGSLSPIRPADYRATVHITGR
jgi:hypothetical protein